MRYYSLLIILIISVYTSNIHSQTFDQDKNTVAVLSLKANGISLNEVNILSDRLRSLLVNSNDYIVVDRANMEDVLREQGFQLSGCTSNDCAVEVGQLLGVKKMITGSVGKFASIYTIELRMIDVETGKIEKSTVYDYKGEIENLLIEGINIALNKLLSNSVILDFKPTKTAEFGSLEINSTPMGANIYLDEKYLGKTPFNLSNLKYGDYHVILNKQDYETFSIKKKITSNKPGIINANMIYKYGNLYLKITPDNTSVNVLLNSRKFDKSKLSKSKLPTGTYNLYVSLKNYYPYEDNFNIKSEQTTKLNVDLKYGLDDLENLKSSNTTRIIISLVGLTTTALSAFYANYNYNLYKDATNSSDAQKYRETTEKFDKITIGLAVATTCFSIYTMFKLFQVSSLKKELGLK